MELLEFQKLSSSIFAVLKRLIHLWICNTKKNSKILQAYGSNKLWLYVQVEIIFFFLTYVIWCSPPDICAFDTFPKKLFLLNRKSNKNKNNKNNLLALQTILASISSLIKVMCIFHLF